MKINNKPMSTAATFNVHPDVQSSRAEFPQRRPISEGVHRELKLFHARCKTPVLRLELVGPTADWSWQDIVCVDSTPQP
jgi:hypothetical protein